MPTSTNQIPTTPTDAAFPRTPEAHHRAVVGKAVGAVQGAKGDRREVVMNASLLTLEHDGRQWVVVSVAPASR